MYATTSSNANGQAWSDIQAAKELLETVIYEKKDEKDKIKDRNHRKEIDDTIQNYLKLASELNVKVTDVVRVRIEYQLLKGEKVDEQAFGHLMQGQKVIKVDNCFIVQNKSKEIIEYLQKVWNLNLVNNQDDVDFISLVEIGEGFVAPCYLITGPLREFEQAWPKISREFDDSLKEQTGDSHIFSRLQSLQSSNFATWIAWGPSIPICECKQWKYHEKDVLVTLQYGFIDENNSLPLLLPDIKEDEILDKIFGKQEKRISEIIVRKVAVKVKLSLLSEDTKAKLASAIISKGNKKEQELTLKLESLHHIKAKRKPKVINRGVKDSIGYYTAYVWILFGVTTEEPNKFIDSFDPKNEQKNPYIWRNLLPFFEHVNLADPLAYARQKRLLVYKALEFIRDYWESQKKEDVQIQKLKFVYLCAFDHPNCGTDKLIISPKEKPMKNILEELKNENYKNLPIVIQEDARCISSCHLPNLIDRLNKHLKGVKASINRI